MKTKQTIMYGLIACILTTLSLTGCPDNASSGGIIYIATQTGGIDGTTDSAGIVFTFSASVDSLNLTAADITVGGAATKGAAALSGSGTIWTLAITVNAAGTATVSIDKAGIEAGAKNVTVYKAGQTAPSPGTPELEYQLITSGSNINTIRVSATTATAGAVIIPATYNGLPVTEIGSFYGRTGLTSITIPASVTTIGDYTFSGCTGLTDITVDADNPNYASEGGILFNKTKIELIAFPSASGNVTIAESVTSIGVGAFSGCTGLTEITIPAGVTSIGNSAFSGCTGLTSITIPASVTTIGDYTFSGCTGLTSITIPASVTTIGDYTFSGCTGLTDITVDADNPNYSGEGGILFNKAKTQIVTVPQGIIGNVTIPEGVTSIGTGAFYGRTGLTSITIPASVTTIGESAFSGCTGLTSITIPESVTTIIGEEWSSDKRGAFSGCTSLRNIIIDNDKFTINYYNIWGSIFPADNLSVTFNKNPGNYAFYICTRLTSVSITESVTSIGNSAFGGCTGLTSITVPEGVTSIGNGAFSGCTGLTSITIPASVTTIGNNAFSDWRNTQTIYIEGYASREAADTAWGISWRDGVYHATIKYWNGTAWV